MLAVSWVPAANFAISRRLAERLDAAAGGGLQRRRAVGVLGDDVAALVDQRLGGVALLRRIVPGELIRTNFIRAFGLIDCMPSIKALMPCTTSGTGTDPT